ncbi:flagellar hook-basal body complex protein FliE [Jeotgalibaca porci]|uniref:flagellar hook-basal body complex protein FliE n=1 Tax=Jeotgalibaca porci TaxID=1868793 RepID=UPI00359F33A1
MNIEASTRIMLDRLNGVEQMESFQTADIKDSNGFGNLLGDAFNQLSSQQIGADQSMQAMIMGEDIEMHDVMIQTTEAQLSLELAVQVRNKCIEAFNEMKNMQF